MKTQKLSELRIYRELFLSEFDKNCFYEQKTYLSIQTTVSCANTVFYITAYCNRAGSKKRFYWLKIWEQTRNSFLQKELILSKEMFLSSTENIGSGLWIELHWFLLSGAFQFPVISISFYFSSLCFSLCAINLCWHFWEWKELTTFCAHAKGKHW